MTQYTIKILGAQFAANPDYKFGDPVLKTDDIHPPKSVISVHFFCLTCLMALQI